VFYPKIIAYFLCKQRRYSQYPSGRCNTLWKAIRYC